VEDESAESRFENRSLALALLLHSPSSDQRLSQQSRSNLQQAASTTGTARQLLHENTKANTSPSFDFLITFSYHPRPSALPVTNTQQSPRATKHATTLFPLLAPTLFVSRSSKEFTFISSIVIKSKWLQRTTRQRGFLQLIHR